MSEKVDPNQAMNNLCDLCGKYMSLSETIENNKTERERIRAEKEKAIRQIEATKELLLTYLNRSFDERKIVFEKDFKAIDAAIAANNMEALAMTVQSVNKLAAQSPFGALMDVVSVKRSLIEDKEIEL